AEPDHQDLLDRGRRAAAADAGRLDLRHELQEHPRARLAVRLSLCDHDDHLLGDRSVSVVQAQRVAVEGLLQARGRTELLDGSRRFIHVLRVYSLRAWRDRPWTKQRAARSSPRSAILTLARTNGSAGLHGRWRMRPASRSPFWAPRRWWSSGPSPGRCSAS